MFSPRSEITFHTVLLAVWIYLGVRGFHNADWTSVGLSAFWIAFCWKRIIEEWDRGKNGED